MNVFARKLFATALVPVLLSWGASRAGANESVDIISPADPRFGVFESHPGPVGTVLLSFISKDHRYCRSARFPAEATVVLACREETGWKVEATSKLSRPNATRPTSLGGGFMPEVGNAVDVLMASIEPMNELEIMDAASRGWLDPDPVDEHAFDARDILRKTARVYMTSQSYRDTGIVRTVYKNSSRQWIGETRFKTAYIAPSEFRFESKMRDMPQTEVDFVAWRSGNEVRAWYNLDPNFEDDITTLQSALDAGAGISRDSSGMIPGLFIPGTKLGGDIVRLTSAERLEDATIDGADCFQVQGFRWPNTGRPTIVWIDKESFLIRQVYEEQEIRGSLTKTTWSYRPALNVPIKEKALRFADPAQD